MDTDTDLENKRKERGFQEQERNSSEFQDKNTLKLKVSSSLEYKLLRKSKLLELSNKKGEILQRELLTARSEIVGVKRILELERREREELENRTLNLIKGARRKWENAERNKNDAQAAQISELQAQLQKTEIELSTSTAELKDLKTLQFQYKESLNKMKELSHQSAQAVKDNLRRMTTRAHDQLAEARKQLELESSKFADLRGQCEIIIAENKQLQNQLEISESKLKDTFTSFESVKQDKENVELQLRISLNKEEEYLRRIDNLEESLKTLDEKKLSDANLDKRLAIKTEEEKIKVLQEEKLKLMEELKKKEQDDQDKSIKLLNEMENVKVSSAELIQESANNKTQADLATKALKESNEKIEELQRSNVLLQRELDASCYETRENQCRVDSLKAENEHLKLQISKQNDTKREYEIKLEKLQKEINTHHVNDSLLKKTCYVLEEQLTDYEKLTNDLERRENIFVQEKTKLENNLQTLVTNIRKCKIVENEEKTRRQIAEKAIKKLDAKIRDIENKKENLVVQRDEYKILTQKLNKQINEFSLKCSSLESELSQMKQLFDMAKKETRMIKEECTQYLSKVYELKELNMNLVSDFKDNVDQCQELRMQVAEREDIVNEMRQFYQEREVKSENPPQTEFKIQEYDKKKKGIYNKLFGLLEKKEKRKENIPPVENASVDYHQFENELKTERTKVENSMQQLLNTKIANLSSSPPVEEKRNLRTEDSEFLRLPQNFENSSSDSSVKTVTTSEVDLPERDTDHLREMEKISMEGWVKLANYDKWESKYLKLINNNLFIYDDVPNSGTKPINCYLNLSRRNGFLISKCQDQIPGTLKSDSISIVKIELNPAETLEIMTLNQLDKKKWLESFQYLSKKTYPFDKYQTILKLERNKLNLNCILEIEEGVLLLGAEEGLYVYHCLEAQILKVIKGVKNVQQLTIHYNFGLALMIAGADRQLMSCSVKQLGINFLYDKHPRPKISTRLILNDSEDCHLYQVEDETLCAATETHIILLKWTLTGESSEFIRMREFKTQEPCSCVLFMKNSLIIGCNKFFQIDMTTHEINDFPETNDISMGTDDSTAGLKLFPICALDVSSDLQNLEILLCYNEFGVFVNGSGQKTRCANLNWSHLPFAFAFSTPYLFVVHFSSVEIIKIDPDSFKLSAIEPERTFLELNNPRYLGLSGKAIYVSTSNFILELLKIEGKSLTPRLSDSIDLLSKDEDDQTDFSFSSGLTEILDGPGYFNNLSSDN